jgi:flagellin
VTNQVTYNSDKIIALNDGLGSLVDANLAQESAQLQALQIRQQLGTQALSIANQAPQSLLSLFK